jgi:thiosulfate/3-mercaptopyruvate sulfurtransferase
MLRVCGFDNAAVLNGGFQKWQAEGRPIEEGECAYPPATSFTLNPRPELMSDKADVISAMNDGSTVLLNSLPEPIFTGEYSLYARPGRIPGSTNLSCESIVDAEKFQYLDLDTIRDMAKQAGALEGGRVITYCGGGIAASSTALVLSMLGVTDLSIYDASLSEWATDPDMPLETG